MPSPFPGMDPFIESLAWPDFYHGFISALSEEITARVRPRYIVRVELRIYVEHESNGYHKNIRSDVTVLNGTDSARNGFSSKEGSGIATVTKPVALTLPLPEKKKEAYLVIQETESREVVTVIEVLSPSNKRSKGDGRREYLEKREQVASSRTNLVELDLLRGGQRLPTVEELPPADFYAFVARGYQLPRVDVFPWTLRQALPTIPIPLREDDDEIEINLQDIFTAVYDRAGYDYSLNYKTNVEPPLGELEEWARGQLPQ